MKEKGQQDKMRRLKSDLIFSVPLEPETPARRKVLFWEITNYALAVIH
jgi:hypothetical protein